MIENKIQMLRRAAKVTSSDSTEDLWCAIAGNKKLVNTVLFVLSKSKYNIKLIFRKNVTIEEKHVHKKFDVIMLKGDPLEMEELITVCEKYGGAHIRIAPNYINTEPNLMLLVSPDYNLRSYVNDLKDSAIGLSILLEDETKGFIETELNTKFKLIGKLRPIFDTMLNASDIVIGNVLISITNEEDINTSKKLAKKNNIFLVDIKKLMQSVEKAEQKRKEEAKKREEEARNREEMEKELNDTE